MKRHLKALYDVNRNWWDSFTSCFIGTLLGIGITFGISGHLANVEKQETARRIQMLTLCDLRTSILSLQEQAEYAQQTDSLFQEVLEYYPDELDEVPAKLVGKVYSSLISSRLYTDSHSAENMFNNNIEVWKTIEELSVINILGSIFDYKRAMSGHIAQLAAIKRQIFDNIGSQYDILGFANAREAMRCFFEDPANRNLMLLYQITCIELTTGTAVLDELFSRIQDKLDITDQELEQVYDDRYQMSMHESHELH